MCFTMTFIKCSMHCQINMSIWTRGKFYENIVYHVKRLALQLKAFHIHTKYFTMIKDDMHFSISALVDCIWTIFKSCGMCQDHVKGCLFHRPKIGLAGIPGVFQRNVSCIVTSARAFIWTSSEFCENAHKHVKRCFSLV